MLRLWILWSRPMVLSSQQLTAASALQENKASRSKVPAGNQKLVVPPALQLWSAVKVLENGYTLSTSMQTFGGIIHVFRIRVCSCPFILRSKLIFRNCPKGSKGTPFRQCVVFISFGSWWFWPKAFSWEILAWKRLRGISPNLAVSIGLWNALRMFFSKKPARIQHPTQSHTRDFINVKGCHGVNPSQ